MELKTKNKIYDKLLPKDLCEKLEEFSELWDVSPQSVIVSALYDYFENVTND